MTSFPKNGKTTIHEVGLPAHRYWQAHELITIGTFAALIKTITILIAIAGGGMNPVSLVVKNAVATSLLIILLFKVPKFGVLTLFSFISTLVALIFMGGNLMMMAGVLVAGIVCDGFLFILNGYHKVIPMLLGITLFDLMSRGISLGYSWFFFREESSLFMMGVVVVAVGYVGCLIGLPAGIMFAKELRHAGIIRE